MQHGQVILSAPIGRVDKPYLNGPSQSIRKPIKRQTVFNLFHVIG